MKKLIALLLTVALCLCCIVPFAGCDNGWIEVQSITYTTEDGHKVVEESICAWDWDVKIITQEEYENAPYELKRPCWISELDEMKNELIDLDRTEFITRANRKTDLTIYCGLFVLDEQHYFQFEKITYKSYELNYVKIKVVNNQKVQIYTKDGIKEIIPLSLTINYFLN